MPTPAILPELIQAALRTIEENAEEVGALDRALGDGDHLTNLQRGLKALIDQGAELAKLGDWSEALQKIGKTVLSTVGGASGSLYGTLFISLGKALRGQELTLINIAHAFSQAVEAVKQRGKTKVGEKTLVDTLEPAACALLAAAHAHASPSQAADQVKQAAICGMEATRGMLATKGRASYLAERSLGIPDAGARTAQLMLCAIADTLVSIPNATLGCRPAHPTSE
ncbi:MAG: dihydroxyacetone kinase subunit DhaL [Methylohalobius sp.]|nr:dihydroxyacetone kinase subunit DhaL [Methylohalobius sp.]